MSDPTTVTESRLEYALSLLAQASDKLHDYCSELNGDLNDSLGTEIDDFIERCNNGQS